MAIYPDSLRIGRVTDEDWNHDCHFAARSVLMEYLSVAKTMNSDVARISIVFPDDWFVPQPASATYRICPIQTFDHSLSGVLTSGNRSENSLIPRITTDCWANDGVLESAAVDEIEEQ